MKYLTVKSITSSLLVLSLLILAGCAQTSRLDLAAIEAAEIANFNAPESNVLSSGQPTQEQFQLMAAAGVKHVVSLRAPGELEWDERAVVEAAGMEFHSIPVSGLGDVNIENAARLDDLLDELGGEAALVHCASSNRVGGLRATTAYDSGQISIDQALAVGRDWGLTGMEQRLREKMSQ